MQVRYKVTRYGATIYNTIEAANSRHACQLLAFMLGFEFKEPEIRSDGWAIGDHKAYARTFNA